MSNVAIWGQRERQLQVQVDPAKLRDKGVTLEQVVSSTGNALWVSPLTFLEASTPGTGGFIDTPEPAHRHPAQPAHHHAGRPRPDPDRRHDERRLTLGDVATVVEDHQPLIGDAVVTGDEAAPDGFMLVVDKLPYANTDEVTKGIDEALDELRPGLTGPGRGLVDLPARRPTSTSRSTTSTRSVLVGGDPARRGAVRCCSSAGGPRSPRWSRWRSSFIVAGARASTPDRHIVQRGRLAGLAIALAAVIDDAIANVDRTADAPARAGRHDGAAARRSSGDRTCGASLETGRSVLWASVIFALALVPLFLMNGLSGDSFYPPMAGAALAGRRRLAARRP